MKQMSMTNGLVLITALLFFAMSACIHGPSRDTNSSDKLSQLDESSSSDAATEENAAAPKPSSEWVSEKNNELADLVGSGGTAAETKSGELTSVVGEGSERVAALAQVDAAEVSKEAPAVVPSTVEVAAADPTANTAPAAETTATTEQTTPSPSEGESPASLQVPQSNPTLIVPNAKMKRASSTKKRATPSRAIPTTGESNQHIILRHGQTMNRFYFLRLGDSASKISRLFYGNDERVNDLIKWNGPEERWNVGDMIFYQSPFMPDENQLRSFFEENNFAPKTYVVQKGDQLSKIAQSEYQSLDSWREIAMVNALDKSANLVVGQKLTLYPADLIAAKVPAPTVETNTEPPIHRVPTVKVEDLQAPEKTVVNEGTSPVAIELAPPPVTAVEKVAAEQERGKKEDLAAMEMSKPTSELPWIALFAGVLTFFAVVYFLLLRRTKEDTIGTDSND